MYFADVDTRLHIDGIRRAGDLLVSEEHAGCVLADGARLEVDTERVVLVVSGVDRHVQATFITQSDSNITCDKQTPE